MTVGCINLKREVSDENHQRIVFWKLTLGVFPGGKGGGELYVFGTGSGRKVKKAVREGGMYNS